MLISFVYDREGVTQLTLCEEQELRSPQLPKSIIREVFKVLTAARVTFKSTGLDKGPL